MSDEKEWPTEIWAAERGDYEPLGTYAVSQHATIPRYAGDPERDHDREFHRYIDADIHESAEKYWCARLAGEQEARSRLDHALREKDEAMSELFRRLDAFGVDYSDLIP